jgi:hypothetical protein
MGRPDELFVPFGAGCSNDLPTQSIVNKLSHPGGAGRAAGAGAGRSAAQCDADRVAVDVTSASPRPESPGGLGSPTP